MKHTDHKRYRSPSRLFATLLMVVASVGLILLSGVWYTAARREQLTARPAEMAVGNTVAIPVTPQMTERYGLEAASRTLDEEGRPNGYLLITAANGYRSRIRVQTVFAEDRQTVVSLRVLYQQETEYLGTRITGEDFLSQFGGRLAPVRLWTTPVQGSPVDGLSGSTISAQAVVTAVNSGYEFLQQYDGL